jgi:hypothetical protein
MKTLGVVGGLALLVAAGCGSDDGPPEEDPERPGLEETVRAYSADFLSGDAAAAYARLSERCRGELTEEVFSGTVADAAAAYGDAEITEYDHELDGDQAKVTYEYSDPAINQTDDPWVYEDGAWHKDC